MAANRKAILFSDHALIPIGENAKDGYAIVDLEDSKWDSFKWCLGAYGYAESRISGKLVKLHRLIANAPPRIQTDHINRVRLDNRRSNLRLVTPQENSYNLSISKANRSGYKGVYWHKQSKKWRAQIRHKWQRINLGLYKNPVEAAEAYDRAVVELRGRDVFRNFM